jgi:hypothetical protein
MFQRASLTAMAQAWNEVFAEFAKKDSREVNWGQMLESRAQQMEADNKVSEMLARVMFPIFQQAQDALRKDDVLQDVAAAYVKTFRFRAENDRWPKDLAEIGCDFPDPFDPGKSIQARFSEHEVRIWSIGPDRINQGGLYAGENQLTSGMDVSLIWPPRKPRS